MSETQINYQSVLDDLEARRAGLNAAIAGIRRMLGQPSSPVEVEAPLPNNGQRLLPDAPRAKRKYTRRAKEVIDQREPRGDGKPLPPVQTVSNMDKATTVAGAMKRYIAEHRSFTMGELKAWIGLDTDYAKLLAQSPTAVASSLYVWSKDDLRLRLREQTYTVVDQRFFEETYT